MHPGIAGRADLEIRRPISVCKVPRLVHADRPVITRRRFNTGELALLAVQFPAVALGHIRPHAGLIRHEANAIDAVAVVESLRLENTLALPEFGAQSHIDEGIAAGRSLERQLKDSPALDRV